MFGRHWSLVSLLLASSVGCGGRTPTKAEDLRDAGVAIEPDAGPTTQRRSGKLDVLFVIDNSQSASFAHPALARTIPYLIDRLLEPPCVNGLGQVVATPPADAACDVGRRDFAPVSDIHLGVISSSLGGHGSDMCSPLNPDYDPAQNEQAQLLTRGAGGGIVPTYAGLGFLVWDPDQVAVPPGDSDRLGFQNKLLEIVNGVGDKGCGYEAPLEAAYRFLVDPEPFEIMTVSGGSAIASGIDQVVLDGRAGFLRPDSAVMIVLVSDEDDCSIIDGGQSYLVAQSNNGSFRMQRARAICDVDPANSCCASCGDTAPEGCPEDPTCSLGQLAEAADPQSLRCFDQKRRFGIDFLYPIQRYVDGLTERNVTTRSGEVMPNPLLVGNRSPAMVTVAAIAGVPWQDISLSSLTPAAGFIPSAEIPWSRVLGDGTSPPEDPLMVPSRSPRTGTHPVTDDALAPPDATSPAANPINGHEHDARDELQYACIYALEQPVPCLDANCACADAATTRFPICQQDDGSYGPLQRFGRATPATRQLELVRALPTRSSLGSICTLPVFDETVPGFAYRPAVDAMLRTLRRSLRQPTAP